MNLTIQRILVPVDFSDFSRAAVDAAIDLGRRFGATVDLLHVWEPPPLRPDLMVWAEADGETLWELARRNAGEQMRELCATLPAGSIRHTEIVPGNPAEVIVERARAEGYDLIVVGTHGRTGVSHLLVGSVAEKVVRLAACPVLTVRMSAAA